MTLRTSSPIQQALEIQLEILKRTENLCDDVCLVCVSCYQEEDDCQCSIAEQVLWPITHVVRMLESVVKGMDES